MSYSLSRMDDGEALDLSNNIYSSILEIAQKHGWDPDGTCLLDEEGDPVEDWDETDYTSNDGQIVSGSDAEDMLNALQEALKVNDCADICDDVEAFVKWLVLEGECPGFEIH